MKNRRLCLIALATILALPAVANAGRRSATYEFTIADATVSPGDSAHATVIRTDTTEDEIVETSVIHDSLEFTLRYLDKTGLLEIQLYNKCEGQVLLIWDSSTATDTEGRMLQIVPFDAGVEIAWDFRFPSKKIGSGKKFRSSLMTLERDAAGSIRLASILVKNDDYYPGDQFLKVLQELKSRRFTIQPVIQRGDRLFRYRLEYAIADARVR